MAQWRDRFLGLPQIPAELTDLELGEFFALSAQDIVAIKTISHHKFRIPAALQLCFVRMTGSRLNDFKVLPRNLLEYIGAQVNEPPPTIASLRTLYKNKSTRIRQQAWAMERLRINAHTKRQERMLVAHLREASGGTSSVDRLIETARQWLFDRKLLIPAECWRGA